SLLRAELLLHGGVAEPLVADRNRVALLRREPAMREEIARGVARVDIEMRRAAGCGDFFDGLVEHPPRALPGHRRMHVEQPDISRLIEADEAYRRAVH